MEWKCTDPFLFLLPETRLGIIRMSGWINSNLQWESKKGGTKNE